MRRVLAGRDDGHGPLPLRRLWQRSQRSTRPASLHAVRGTIVGAGGVESFRRGSQSYLDAKGSLIGRPEPPTATTPSLLRRPARVTTRPGCAAADRTRFRTPAASSSAQDVAASCAP